MLQVPETVSIAVNMNDRLGRRLILLVNNDQKCVVGIWIEEDIQVSYPTITNRDLYQALFQLPISNQALIK